MLAGSPVTVWRYVTFWLWRLLLLTAAILVTVLTFAGAVKFLAEGKLSPLDTLRFMFYLMPPMLQYALPFAGGFAATLTYHRFAADNEAVACQAGGVSYRSLLAPAMISGLVLALTLVALSERIIPSFLRSMQEMVTVDASRMMLNSIKRGDAVRFGNNTLIYADNVERMPAHEQHGAYQVLWLSGVLVVRLSPDGQNVIEEGTAKSAFVWFFREAGTGPWDPEGASRPRGTARTSSGFTRITMVPQDFVGHQAGRAIGRVERTTYSITVPAPGRDNIKFFGWRELRELREDPDRLMQIDSRRRGLATILAERAVVQEVRDQLRNEGRARFVDALGETVILRGSGLEWDPGRMWYQISPAATRRATGITVERYSGDRLLQTIEGQAAWFRSILRPESPGEPMTFEVLLETVTAEGTSTAPSDRRAASGEATQMRERPFRNLVPAKNPLPAIMRSSSAELLIMADEHLAEHDWDHLVRGPRDDLRRRLGLLKNEIIAKEQERMAMAAACMVMVLLGGVMAMRLRDSLPLVVYLWGFFPALAAVITIVGGQQLTQDVGIFGLPLLWGGVGGLAAFAGVEYWKLRKH